MKRLLSVVLLALGFSSGLFAQKPDPTLDKLGEQYQAAVNKGDAKAVAALHTVDAFRLGSDGRFLSGRAAIEKDFLEALAGPFKGAKLTLRPGRTQMLAADVAMTEGTYEITGGSNPRKGRYVTVAKREGGEWLYASVTSVRVDTSK